MDDQNIYALYVHEGVCTCVLDASGLITTTPATTITVNMNELHITCFPEFSSTTELQLDINQLRLNTIRVIGADLQVHTSCTSDECTIFADTNCSVTFTRSQRVNQQLV